MDFKIDTITFSLLRQIQCNTADRTEFEKVSCIVFIHAQIHPERVTFLHGVDISTVCRFIDLFKSKGIEFLQTNYEGYKRILNDSSIQTLKHALQSKLYLTLEEMIEWVSIRFKIKYNMDGPVKLSFRIGSS